MKAKTQAERQQDRRDRLKRAGFTIARVPIHKSEVAKLKRFVATLKQPPQA